MAYEVSQCLGSSLKTFKFKWLVNFLALVFWVVNIGLIIQTIGLEDYVSQKFIYVQKTMYPRESPQRTC